MKTTALAIALAFGMMPLTFAQTTPTKSTDTSKPSKKNKKDTSKKTPSKNGGTSNNTPAK